MCGLHRVEQSESKGLMLPTPDKHRVNTTQRQVMKESIFLASLFGYHQISIAKSDKKTSFIADFGTYCYTAMLFGLKNIEATYQKIVNRVFRGLIRRIEKPMVMTWWSKVPRLITMWLVCRKSLMLPDRIGWSSIFRNAFSVPLTRSFWVLWSCREALK